MLSRLPGMVYQCRNDPDWTMQLVTGGCLALTGHEPAELIEGEGTSYGSLVHPEDRDEVWERVQEAVREHRQYELEYRITTADGSEKWVWEQGHPVLDPHGRLLGLEGYISDITELRRKTEELAASRRMISALTEQSLFGVYVIQEGLFRFVNDAMAHTFGYEAREMVNRMGPLDIVTPEDRETVGDNIRRRIQGEVASVRYTFEGLKKDGSRIEVEVFGARSEVNGRPAVSGVLVDVTERGRLQEQVVRAQKMEAVGLLASGIAHDFNNILTAVAGHARLLLDDLPDLPDSSGDLRVQDFPDRDSLTEGLHEIRSAAERATDLTRELLVFSREEPMDRVENSDVNTVVTEVRRMARSVIGDNIEVELKLEASEPWVRLDSGRLGQVLMNLVVNARDAMPKGGRLTIRTATVELDEGYADAHFEVDPGTYVQLSVADTGIGMSREVRERIFEPFFSTKERTKGTGLGLSTIYGILKQAGGHVWVYSEPGRGSHFKLQFPLARPADRPESERSASGGPEADSAPAVTGSPLGGGTVLLVDDDPSVLAVTAKILRRNGHEVISAADSGEAIRLFEELAGHVDLVITDVVLPTLSGPQLVHRLREMSASGGIARREFAVMFVSGYSRDSVNRDARLHSDAAFLEKPFDSRALESAVRALLGRAATDPAGEGQRA